MKYLLILLSFFFAELYAFDSIYSKITFDDSKVCIGTKEKNHQCSSNTLTKDQLQAAQRITQKVSENIPKYITNDILNNFLKFNPTFNSRILLGTFSRVNQPMCQSAVNVLNKRRPEIQRQINKLHEQLRNLDRNVVTDCTDGEYGKAVYPDLPNIQSTQ